MGRGGGSKHIFLLNIKHEIENACKHTSTCFLFSTLSVTNNDDLVVVSWTSKEPLKEESTEWANEATKYIKKKIEK